MLRKNPQLIVLPLIALVASVLVLVAVAAPVMSDGYQSGGQLLLLGAIALLVVGGVQAFFHAALTAGAVDHFEGRRPTVGSTIAVATTLGPMLAGWAIISWLVSALAAVIRDRVPVVGPLVAGLGEAVWGVVTFLSMPVMVIERVGPIQSIRRSGELLKKTWGENLLGQLGFGLFAFLLLIPVAVVAGVGAVAIHPWVGIGLCTLGVIATFTYVNALDAIYRVALYRHATAAESAQEFAAVGFDDAFTTKKRRWF